MSRFVTEIKNEQGYGWLFEIWWRTELTMIARGYAPTRKMARELAKTTKAAYEAAYKKLRAPKVPKNTLV